MTLIKNLTTSWLVQDIPVGLLLWQSSIATDMFFFACWATAKVTIYLLSIIKKMYQNKFHIHFQLSYLSSQKYIKLTFYSIWNCFVPRFKQYCFLNLLNLTSCPFQKKKCFVKERGGGVKVHLAQNIFEQNLIWKIHPNKTQSNQNSTQAKISPSQI